MAAKVAEAAISRERRLELAKIATRSKVWWPEGERTLQEVELVNRTHIFW